MIKQKKSISTKDKKGNKLTKFMHNHKVWSTIIIIVAIILILVIATTIFFFSKTAMLDRNGKDGVTSSQAGDDDLSDDMKGVPAGKVKEAEGAVFGDKNVFNLMIIGTDERSKNFSDNARGDTCMILSINKESGVTKLVSFERGQGVKILDGQYKGQYDWLTHSFEYGGADLMMKEIRESYKIDVTHYIRANIYTYMQLIDSVGGVDVTLTKEEANYINNPSGTYAESHIKEMNVADKIQKVQEGANHLNGATAMLYSRCRAIDSDWNRVERQRNVIKAATGNMKKLNPIELNSLLNNVLPYLKTNLTNSEILNLITLFPKYNNICGETMTIPQKGTYGSMKGMGDRPMFAVDFQKNSDILKEFLYGVKSK